jgi:hypothetical protein
MLLGRNRARPRCTVHSAAHYHVMRGPAWPQLARAWRTAHGGTARRGEATVGTRRGRRGDGQGDGGAREVVGTRRGWRGNGGGTERGAAVGRARRGRGCCRDVRRAVPTVALSCGALSRGPGAARRTAADRWGPLSAISELKFTPKEISSN